MADATTSDLSLMLEAQDSPIETILPLEIFEMITLLLPISKILTIQRVSKTWNSRIKTSAKLQRALFLKPTLESKECCFKTKSGPKNWQRHSWNEIENEEAQKSWMEVLDPKNELAIKPILNPLLKPFFYDDRGRYRLVEFARLGKFRNGELQQTNINALSKGGDSWKRMWVLHPPVKVLRFGHRPLRLGSFDREGGSISNQNGVTMGDLVERYMSICKDYESALAAAQAQDGRLRGLEGRPALQIHGFREGVLKVLPKALCVCDILAEIKGETTDGKK